MYEAKPKKPYFYMGILLLSVFIYFSWSVVKVNEHNFYYAFFLVLGPVLLSESIYLFLVYFRKRMLVNVDNLILVPIIKKKQIISYEDITRIVIYNNGMMRLYKGGKVFTISSAYEQYNEILHFFINSLPTKISYSNHFFKF